MKSVRMQRGEVFPDLPPVFDRRERERVALRIPIRILSYGLLMEKANPGTCIDLSEGGVSLETDAELNVGDLVTLEFQQKGEAAYRCHARLSYRMGRRYGAYFLMAE